MTPLDRSRTWRHELIQKVIAVIVAVAAGVMLAGWALVALVIVVKVDR